MSYRLTNNTEILDQLAGTIFDAGIGNFQPTLAVIVTWKENAPFSIPSGLQAIFIPLQVCSDWQLCSSLVFMWIIIIYWVDNTGEYSVRGWQYWPDCREGQYITRELNTPFYCPTQKECNNRFIIIMTQIWWASIEKNIGRCQRGKGKRKRKEKEKVLEPLLRLEPELRR